MVVSTAAMGLVKTISLFYILGAIRGLCTAMFSFVLLTMIINKWFVKKNEMATSIVLGCSGIGGSVFSPALSSCIENFGWQLSYMIEASIILLLCMPALIYPFSVDPKDEGLLAYGYQETAKGQSKTKKDFHFASLAFICFFIFGLFASCITSVTQHLPGYGNLLGIVPGLHHYLYRLV